MQVQGLPTYTGGEALEANRRVKIESGTTASPPEVVYADAGEASIGVTQYAVLNGERVAVKEWNAGGTFEIECVIDSAIARGTKLYGAADGKVTDTVSGPVEAIANQAPAVDNEHIECLPGWLMAIKDIWTHMLSAQQFIPIPLTSWREVSSNDIPAISDTPLTDDPAGMGGLLAKNTTPNLEFTNGDTDSALRLEWAASNSDPIATQIPLSSLK